jgi:hypothetical protein
MPNATAWTAFLALHVSSDGPASKKMHVAERGGILQERPSLHGKTEEKGAKAERKNKIPNRYRTSGAALDVGG